MTVEQWRETGFWQRFYYKLARHPITIVLASVTVFLFSNCLAPALTNPKKEWSGLLAIAVNAAIITGLWFLGGFWLAFFAWILPYAVATALGAYLFFAQHNFPGMKVLDDEHWNLPDAAMVSCSWMNLGPFMRWFTGEIGYHHVHHLNAGIPFYRLEEAMKALPETQQPAETSLRPRDIWGCFRLKLWDPERDEMVTFKQARAS
jgi:omega-6 fatty acid desaturase (delta-12 desaturase)